MGAYSGSRIQKDYCRIDFLRYISSAFEKRYQELIKEGDGFEDDRDAYTMENVFFVPEGARWSTISAAAHSPEIGTVIDHALLPKLLSGELDVSAIDL